MRSSGRLRRWSGVGLAIGLAVGSAPVSWRGAGRLAAQAPDPDSVVAVEGVRVSVASRLPGDARTRAVSVLDRTAIESLAATTVSEALRWVVGVDLQPRSAAQADVSVRGGTSEQVLVLVDGVPMSDAQTGHFDLDLAVPLDRVARIEVLRGAASAVYGADAVGGVINVVTEAPPQAATGRVRVEGGSFGRVAASVRGGGSVGAWSAQASARLDRADGHREGTDHDLRLGDLRVTGPVAAGRLDVRLGWAARDFGAAGFYAPFPSYEETRTRTVSARWSQVVGGAGGSAVVEVASHLREHDDDFVLRRGDPAFYRNVHASRQSGVDLVVRSVRQGPWAWSAGVAAGRDALESTSLGDRTADRGAVFGELGWAGGPGGRARVRGGLRLDARDGFAPAWAPSLSAGWAVASSVRIRAAAARSHRTPTWTDRFYEDPANRGDPNLRVETAWSTEFGVDWTPSGSARLRATGFVREAHDLIDYARRADDPVDAIWQTRNVESASFRGVELEVDGVEAGPARLQGSLELLDVSTTAGGDFVSKYALRPLTRTARVGAFLPLPAGLSAAVQIENRRRVGERDHTAADLHLEARLGATRLWLDATNLGDATWTDVSGLPAPGRAFRTGVSIGW